MIFKMVMITFTKSAERLDNYVEIKKTLPNIELFEAYDSINSFEDCISDSIVNEYATKKYIESCKDYPGKLGCNLSHIHLLKNFLDDKDYEWLMVLEDDIYLNNFNEKIFEFLIKDANRYGSNFVNLYTHPGFQVQQEKSYKVNYKLFKMIPQWGTVAYLINKTGIEILLSKLPWEQNIDKIISNNIEELNALCYLNNIIINKGSVDNQDKNSKFGSLIWKIEPKFTWE